MKLHRTPRRAASESIVALIDVVFFLLVFFMVVGRMDATAPFAVVPPLAQSASPMPGGGVTVSVGLDGDLALDGVALPPQALRAALAGRLAKDPALLVRINAHRQAELRRILPLAADLEAMGARDVVLVVTPAGGA